METKSTNLAVKNPPVNGVMFTRVANLVKTFIFYSLDNIQFAQVTRE